MGAVAAQAHAQSQCPPLLADKVEEAGAFNAADDDEQSGEEQQHRPVDLAQKFIGIRSHQRQCRLGAMDPRVRGQHHAGSTDRGSGYWIESHRADPFGSRWRHLHDFGQCERRLAALDERHACADDTGRADFRAANGVEQGVARHYRLDRPRLRHDERIAARVIAVASELQEKPREQVTRLASSCNFPISAARWALSSYRVASEFEAECDRVSSC
jgi:hypothetical protein